MKRLSLFIMFSAAVLMTACNGIDNVGPDAESLAAKHKTSTIIRDVNVSQNEAIDIANKFVRSNADGNVQKTKSSFASTKIIRSSETISEDGNNLMYVFNYQGGGFVIIGSTRNYYPILAYSDKGSFALQDDMGPIDVWLDETKESIKNSNSLDEATKSQMRNLWARYDGTITIPSQSDIMARRPKTRSTGEDACWYRIDSLQQVHSGDGWTFTTLSEAESIFTSLGLSSYYTNICYSATQNHSALNETLIGYKNPVSTHVGPVIGTEWHPLSPFNDLCPANAYAGYGPIAVAQVMKKHERPISITWGQTTFGWNSLTSVPTYTSTDRHAQLIRYLWEKLNVFVASPTQVLTTVQKIKDGLDSIGYTTNIINPHSDLVARNQLVYYSRPVIMYGKDNTQNISHFWVCEGVTETDYDQILFYTENQPNGTGNFTQGMYTLANPGSLGGGNPYRYFYMNWGMGSSPYYNPNGWYSPNNVILDGYNLSSDRKDVTVSWLGN